MHLNLFSTRKPQPQTLRVTVAVYPDGYECRIERAPKIGAGYWTYGRGSAAGPRKADAIRSAENEGARIETRTIPHHNHRPGR